MSDIKIDLDSKDILLSPYDLQIVSGTEALQQRLKIRLDIQRGEWFLDQTEGLPYRDYPDANVNAEILVRNPNLARISALFRARIVTTEGVDRLQSFSLNFDINNGCLELDFIAITDDELAIQGTSTGDDVFSLIATLLLQPLGGIA